METRVCSKCGGEKTVDKFPKGSNWRRCKECINAAVRAWYNGSPEAAEQLKEDRAFRRRMDKEGFAHCGCCRKWFGKDRFSVDNKRKNKLYPYCKDCQHQKKNAADAEKREREITDFRAEAKRLFDACQRECPHCGRVYQCDPPKNMRGTSPRWWAAWKTCRDCRRVKDGAKRFKTREHVREQNNRNKKKDPVKRLYYHARSRRLNNSGRKLVDFDITLEQLRELWHHQGGRCAVTGVAFDTTFDTPKNPLSPSLDRIDSNRGYVPGNVRFVLWAVNAGMSDWGLPEYLTVATRALEQQLWSKYYGSERLTWKCKLPH